MRYVGRLAMEKYFQIKIGQFFVFYDHENLEPTWALQFLDRLKLQADYSRLWNNAATQGRNDDRVRLQTQLFF